MLKKVAIQNPYTKEIQTISVGWSWYLFLLSPVFGIPLFRKGLTFWGMLFLAMNCVAILGLIRDPQGNPNLISNVVACGLMVFIGLKGNELTAKNYLARGWTFVDPESDAVKYAMSEWQLNNDSVPYRRTVN